MRGQERLRHHEQGGDAGLAQQHRPAVPDHLDVVGRGLGTAGDLPDLNSSTAAELGVVGLMKASPPPVEVVVSPCCLSQSRSATSWVLPSDGVASDLPLSWAAELTRFETITEAPPVATPEMILIAVPLDFCQALIAGLGPT